ncbi:hypothetical protein BDZ89DRAFT_1067725 [Hymenopellis radicata]|nr:hypothetical protein BDZ89DRAFT_1067725 [Hymenopellis radicata]
MKASHDSRSTVNCDPYILRLPNEILLLIFNVVTESQYLPKFALHRLAVVCRRFRDILQEADLIEMFKVLPPHLQELDLAGFSWTSAAKALAVAQQPNLQRLSLNLQSPIPGAPMAPAKLTAYFPALVHIHIPSRWCPQPSWFIEAFLGSKLEHIAVGFTGSFVSFIERVTTVAIRHIDFRNAHHLAELVRPFATMSITSLRFDGCSGIPPMFARWFEDTEQSRHLFPALKELERCGRSFEKNCKRRGIDAVFHWDFFT